jgi:hypothetical protein
LLLGLVPLLKSKKMNDFYVCPINLEFADPKTIGKLREFARVRNAILTENGRYPSRTICFEQHVAALLKEALAFLYPEVKPLTISEEERINRNKQQ